MLKSKSFYLILFFVIGLNFWIFYPAFFPKLPEPGSYPVLYSNQCRQDLKVTLLEALKKAKKSIHMVMFGLTDPSILKILNQKAKENLDMKIFYDLRSSSPIDLPNKSALIYPSKGLVHQKILIIDQKFVFIGSANLTTASLRLHDNLIVGLYSPDMAKFLLKNSPHTTGYCKSMVGGQFVELWLLPDHQNKALASLRSMLQMANKKIHISMFTLTHPVLVEELIKAKKRGTQVVAFVDIHSAMGSGAKAIERLKQANIYVKVAHKGNLFHHKFICIDDKRLILGSANWTKSAFDKNRDCFLVLHHLNPKQKKFMKKLQNIIEKQTK